MRHRMCRSSELLLLSCFGLHACLYLQEGLKVREDEIARLGKEASRGKNVDALALQHRCEAQECLILQLSEQVVHLIPDRPGTCAKAV